MVYLILNILTGEAGADGTGYNAGDTIFLSAEDCTDPDGNDLSYNWFCYPEAGTFALQNGRSGNLLKIKDFNQPRAYFIIPKTARRGTLHIILAVTDDGTPALTRYARLIIDSTTANGL